MQQTLDILDLLRDAFREQGNWQAEIILSDLAASLLRAQRRMCGLKF